VEADPRPADAPEPDAPEPDEPGDGDDERERLRREAAKHRRDARAAQQQNDELRQQLERHRVESESEQERAIREAVEAERTKLTQEFAAERLHNRLRIRATAKLRDPEDAVLHLGNTLEADADNAAIDKALEELIAERDYLAKPEGNGGRDAGLVTQGGRSQAPGSSRESSPDDWIRGQVRSG
jgi:hypothetical protein